MLSVIDRAGNRYTVGDLLPGGSRLVGIMWPQPLVSVQPPPHGRVIRSAAIHAAAALDLKIEKE